MEHSALPPFHKHEHISGPTHSEEGVAYLHPWEKSCHALIDILERKNLVLLNEKIGKWVQMSCNETIDGQAYYEHWILAAMQVLLDKGLIQHEEISKKSHEVALRAVQHLSCVTQ
jgi:hypothetical protein